MKKNTNKTPKNILRRLTVATILATLLVTIPPTTYAQTTASALAVQLAKNTNTAYKPAEIKQPGGTIYFDGKPIDMMGTTILNANSSTLLPIAPIAKALNTEPMWDAENKVAKISYNGHYAECVQGSDKVILDGSTTKKSAVPTINHNSRVYLPLRTLSESLGLNVSYDANTKNVYITTTSAQAKPVEPLPGTLDLNVYYNKTNPDGTKFNQEIINRRYNDLKTTFKLTDDQIKTILDTVKSTAPNTKPGSMEYMKYQEVTTGSEEWVTIRGTFPSDQNLEGQYTYQPHPTCKGWYWNGNNWEPNAGIYYGH